MRIALHQAGWDGHFPGEFLTAATELGYDGVELAPPYLEVKYNLEEIYRQLIGAGTIMAPACFVGGQEMRALSAKQTYLAKARKYARWTRSHGGSYVIYSTVSGARGDRSSEERRDIREAFRLIPHVVCSEGCQPLYHNHYVGGSCEVSQRLLQEDLADLDMTRWSLCVDTGHLVLALTDPVVFVDKWARKISWMHCKDAKTADPGRLRRNDVPPWEHFTPMGSGVVDFSSILRTLADTGSLEWLVVEQDKPPDPYASAKTSIRYLRGLLSQL